MTTLDKVKFVAIRTVGNFLLLVSLYGVFATFGPVLMYEVQFRISEFRGINYVVSDTVEASTTEGGPSFSDVLAGSKEQVISPKDASYSLIIPKIGASAKVHPNVDAGNEAEFQPLLQTGVAHAKGTVFPGMSGNIYLFAHSTDNWWNVGRYNAVFYLLKELEQGDDIDVFFENIRHRYVVQGSQILDPDDVSFLNNRGDKEQLILQTCWPPGTTWKRLYVTAIPKAI